MESTSSSISICSAGQYNTTSISCHIAGQTSKPILESNISNEDLSNIRIILITIIIIMIIIIIIIII